MVIVIVVETKSTVDIISTVVLIFDSKNYTLYTSPFGSRSSAGLWSTLTDFPLNFTLNLYSKSLL